MAMDRWDPFREMMSLREAMDRLLQESVVRPTSLAASGGRGALPLDVSEDGNDYVIKASLPGIKPEDVQITVQGDTLTIRGETTSERNEQKTNYLVRERRSGSFYRTLTLPTQVDADQAQASFEHGELMLRLPKAHSARPRQIKVGSQAQQVAGGQPQGQQPAQASQEQGGNGRAQSAQAQAGDDVVNEASRESFPASDAPGY